MKFERFGALVSSGVSVLDALELSGVKTEPEFQLLTLAIESGAPLAPTARAIAHYQQNLKALERELAQAQAMPQATRRLMLWLPAFGIGLGELLGFGSIAALGSTAGLIGFLLALSLVYLGASITGKMLDRIRNRQEVPGAHWFRLGILLAAGLGLAQALRESEFPEESNQLIELALESGASLGVLILAQQESELANHLAQKTAQAKALSVRLLIPLGLTTLPAFLIFTVLPMLIGINNK